ncbi:Dynein assembly factor 4, axonemal [Sergentomyia squamirostris]
MVLSVKKIEWTQTLEEVHVRILFSSKISSRVDVFTHRDFIKINFQPIFREIFLSHPVDESQSKYRILENEIKFNLKKSNPIMWDSVEKNVRKADRIELKQKIIEESQKLGEEEKKQKAEQRTIIKQNDIRKEISRETQQRNQIDEINKSICKTEEAKITQITGEPEKITIKTNVPGVRKNGNIFVGFTNRSFPTPKRESQDHLEQEWFQKQHEARKIIGFVEEDLRPEERNLDWLQDKASTFFHNKNYLGAIAVYSNAIKLAPKCYNLYLQRSTCQWFLGNFQRCIEDCSSAYDLLTPAVPSNLSARIQCLARRGAALCKLGYLEHGLGELKAAFALDSTNENLSRDIEMIEEKLQDLDDSDN